MIINPKNILKERILKESGKLSEEDIANVNKVLKQLSEPMDTSGSIRFRNIPVEYFIEFLGEDVYVGMDMGMEFIPLQRTTLQMYFDNAEETTRLIAPIFDRMASYIYVKVGNDWVVKHQNNLDWDKWYAPIATVHLRDSHLNMQKFQVGVLKEDLFKFMEEANESVGAGYLKTEDEDIEL